MKKTSSRSIPDGVNIIISAALKAVDPAKAVKKFVQYDRICISVAGHRFKLDPEGLVYLIGVGKGVQSMASALMEVAGDLFSSGFIITKHIDADFTLPDTISINVG